LLEFSKHVKPALQRGGVAHEAAGSGRDANRTNGCRPGFSLRSGGYFGIVGTMNNSDAVTTLAALAQESRLAVFRLLVRHAPTGLTVGVIAEQLDLPAPTLSFHLKTLAHAGLVNTTQEGRFVRVHACVERIDGLVGFLTESCCNGHPEICRPRMQPTLDSAG